MVRYPALLGFGPEPTPFSFLKCCYHKYSIHLKEARKGFFGGYSVCETMKDTKEGYFTV